MDKDVSYGEEHEREREMRFNACSEIEGLDFIFTGRLGDLNIW